MVQSFSGNASSPSEEIFAVFFTECADTQTTPLPVDCHTPHANLATQRNDKVKKQGGATMAEFTFCMEAITLAKAARVLRNWLVEQKESAVLISTLTALEHVLQG